MRTIAINSAGAGNGGRKNQRSVRVMNNTKCPPGTNCRNITVCSWCRPFDQTKVILQVRMCQHPDAKPQ